jgi:site-specific DNA recombinase
MGERKDGEQNLRIFIYSRKSVYTGKGESVENQVEMCKSYITDKLLKDSKAEINIYEDEGFSAKNTNRPQFQQMLRDIKQMKPQYIVCYRLDRISRNVSDFSSLIEELNHHNISFVCIREEFDTSKPMGKAMMYIASVFAQLERETIAERVRDNMLLLARTGRWLGGTTPMGYTSEKIQEVVIDGKLKIACKLKDNPGELKVVDCIHEKFLELRSVSGVSKYLIKQGMKTRNGNMFSLPGIKEILQNPVYCTADEDAWEYFKRHQSDVCFEKSDCSDKYALLAYNKRDYRKKSAPRQDMEKWIVAMGKHKGRISGKRWVEIQDILRDNIPTGKKPALMHNDYSMLSGMIYCDKCNSRMFAKQRGGKSGGQLYDYICNSKLRGGLELCNCQNINGQQADEMIYESLIQYMNENAGILSLLEKLKREFQRQVSKNPSAVLEDKIKKSTGEIDNLIHTLSHEELGAAFISRVNERIKELDVEITSLKEERDLLKDKKGDKEMRDLKINQYSMALWNLKESSNILSMGDKRTLVKLMVKKIVWDGTELHVYMGN